MRLDDFWEKMLLKDYMTSLDFAKEHGYPHEEVLYYFQRIQRDRPGWILGYPTNSPDCLAVMRLNEDYVFEVREFLKKGGYADIEKREKQKDQLDIENLRLIRSQRREIWITRIIAIIGLAASLYFGLKGN